MPSEKTSSRALQVDSGSESFRSRMYPAPPLCVEYSSINRPPPTGRMRPPGRFANVSSAGCSWNEASPSVLTDNTSVKLPSEFRRFAHTQMRPSESRAISPRWYAVVLEVESKTLTLGCGIQSPEPFQRHHWKKTSCSVEPEMSGPSYENTIATSIPTAIRSAV